MNVDGVSRLASQRVCSAQLIPLCSLFSPSQQVAFIMIICVCAWTEKEASCSNKGTIIHIRGRDLMVE